MKKWLLVLTITFTIKQTHAQFVHKIKADSVLITNDSCTAELNLENSTKNIKGFLYNKGNGRTEFRKMLKLNDSTLIMGSDTLVIGGNSNFTASEGIRKNGKNFELGDIAGQNTTTLSADRYLRSGNKSIYLQGNKTNHGNPNLIFDDTLSANGFKNWIQFNSLTHNRPPYTFFSGATDDGTGRINSTFGFGFNLSDGGTLLDPNYCAFGVSMEGSYQGHQEWHDIWVDKKGNQYRLRSYTIDTAAKDVDFYQTVSRNYWRNPNNGSGNVYAFLQGGTNPTFRMFKPDGSNYAHFSYQTEGSGNVSFGGQNPIDFFYLANFNNWVFPGLSYVNGAHNFDNTPQYNVSSIHAGLNTIPNWPGFGLLEPRFVGYSTTPGSYSMPFMAVTNQATSKTMMLVTNTNGDFSNVFNSYLEIGMNGKSVNETDLGPRGRADIVAGGNEITSFIIGTAANANNPPLKFLSNGIERLIITGNGRLKLMTPPPSGTATDSILTWNAADSVIRKIAQPKRYVALLSQTGTSGPNAIVLENGLSGTITWTRNAAGNYTGTLTGAFIQNKTWFHTEASDQTGNVVATKLTWNSANTVTLIVKDGTLTNTDGWTNLSIEIRVYP